MRMRIVEHKISVAGILSGLVIGMILPLSLFVNDAAGGGPGPTCSPCEYWSYTLGRCTGCETDCPGCHWCDGSIPRCKSLCLSSECKSCDRCVRCKICGDDPNKFCCNGHCCNRALCEECVGGQCLPCGGDANKACCNGTSYDKRTQKCCRDTSPGYICDINKICCNGSCCDPPKCCDNGVCKGPKCDNCHCYDRNFDECLHYATDPCGTPCSTTMCIHNELSTATCDYHSDSNCPSKCTAEVQATGTGCWQTVYRCPCPGGTVNWHQFVTFYTGCPTCTGWNPGGDSCLTDSCSGLLVAGPLEHGALWDCTGTCP